MSLYQHDRIDKPQYLRLAPLKQGRGSRPVVVVGFDSEAVRGAPALIQLSSGGGWADAELFDLPAQPNVALAAFVGWVQRNCARKNVEYLIFGYNLQYEWTQLFGDVPLVVSASKEFTLTTEFDGHQRWQLDVMNFRRHAMIMKSEETGIRVRVLDAQAYYPGGLAAVAKMLGVEEKDEIDKDILANLTRDQLQDPVVRKYSAQDAVTTRLVGERIVEMHEEFDVTTCISAPQLSAKVFRRQFLHAEIPLANEALEQAGLYSYHGGKNGYYHRGPLEADAWALDKVSAYPEAMRALPALEEGRWSATSRYQEGVHGLWLVRLTHKPCKYGGLFTHGGMRLRKGQAEVWVTSYELDVMLSHGEATKFQVLEGFVLEGPTGEGSGLTTYVDRFFAEKRVSKGPARATAKLMLNSLYGKFFQKQPVGVVGSNEGRLKSNGEFQEWVVEHAIEQRFDYRAGGLYHPPVASLITGFVRAQIHELEHRYDAIATSTDGFFSRRAPRPEDIGEDLGMLTADHGYLRIWRERLYAFGEMPDGPVSKFALHGFRAKLDVLQEIPLESGDYKYDAAHPVTLREATGTLRGRKYRPGEFALLDFTLKLG